MKAPTLTGQLLGWILGALVLLWAAFIAIGYETGEHEADELTDGHLAAVAALFANQRGGEFVNGSAIPSPGGHHDLKAHDYQRSMRVIVWDATGRLLTQSAEGPAPMFSLEEGFATIALGEPHALWRGFSKWSVSRDRKVLVLLSLNERDALARDIAGQITEPGLWVLPVLALGLGLAVRQGLRPLYSLSREINSLDIRKPVPLDTANRHEEFRAAIEAINTLVGRYHASVVRERALADEFAHELRTPLTSLGLQVGVLRDLPAGPQRDAALSRMEKDVGRAGEIISHLLALARASRTEMDEVSRIVDLAELARRVVGDCAQLAYESGHELSFSSIRSLQVKGHPVLLELALRNLIENAISHTPAGTQVQVHVLDDVPAIEVRDFTDQRTHGEPLAHDSFPGKSLELGLGHRVVQKVADIHGARFEKLAPIGRYVSCYRLTFDAPRQSAGA
ncbi:MAG: two-component sensor histidine kinase [Ramlibacter sp.]|nr:two-component sensor histidine kinase [Ramlibacter sp.]